MFKFNDHIVSATIYHIENKNQKAISRRTVTSLHKTELSNPKLLVVSDVILPLVFHVFSPHPHLAPRHGDSLLPFGVSPTLSHVVGEREESVAAGN